MANHSSGNAPWLFPIPEGTLAPGLDNIDTLLDANTSGIAALAGLAARVTALETEVATIGGGSVNPAAARAAIQAASLGMAPNPQSGNYTFVAADALGGAVRGTGSTTQTMTIPTDVTATWPVTNPVIPVYQGGAGVINIAAAAGVTILAPPTGFTASTSGQGTTIELWEVSANTWVVLGQLGTTTVTTTTPSFTDTWTGANGAAWASSWTTFAGGGTIDIQSNRGRALNSTGTGTNGPNAWLNGVAATADFDVTVDVYLMGGTVDQIVSVGGNSVGGNCNNGLIDEGYCVALLPGSSKFRVYGSNYTIGHTQVGTDQTYTFPAAGTGVTVHFKKLGTAFTVTVRTVGASEPTSGTGFYSFSDASITTSGKPALAMANGSPTTATTVSYDNIAVV